MRFIGDIALDAEVRAIASGAITDGEPVVVNSAGTVSACTVAITGGFGTAAEFENARTQTEGPVPTTFDSSNNKVIIGYVDVANSSYGTAIVATVDPSDNSISYGTPVVFESASSSYIALSFDSNVNKVIIAYMDSGDSNACKAIIGTVSGTGISFGSAVTFKARTGANSILNNSLVFDSNANKTAVFYVDFDDSQKLFCRVISISGTTPSYGTEVEVVGQTLYGSSSTAPAIFDSNSNKIVVFYTDVGDSNKGKARVGTISGTDISFGTAAEFESGAYSQHMSATFDTTNNKVVLNYQDNSNSSYGTLIVGTVSGTDITFGTPVIWASFAMFQGGIEYDSSVNRLFVSGYNSTTGDKGHFVIGEVSGTSISIGSTAIFLDFTLNRSGHPIYDSNAQRIVIPYIINPSGVSDRHGFAIVYKTEVAGNLTSENFIGIANAAYADGQKATVKTTGSIARNALSIPAQSASSGSHVTFETGMSTNQGIAYDTNLNRVVITYRDQGNSNYGTAIVGTLDGTSISFGTPVVFESAETNYTSVAFDSSNNKMVIAFQDAGNSNYGKAIVGTVSGTAISFGSVATFNSGTSSYISVAFDSNSNKAVIAYQDAGNSSYGTAIVATVSGTSISFGSEAVFESASTSYVSSCFDSNSNKVVISYRDSGNSHYGTSIVGTVSSTSISFGTAVVFESANSSHQSIAFDSSNNKVVTSYKASNTGKAIVGTVSSTSISFGTASTFSDASVANTAIVYDTSRGLIHIAFSDIGNSEYLAIITGTVSSTSISFGSKTSLNSVASVDIKSVYVPDGNYITMSYRDNSVDGRGKSVVYSPPSDQVNLTIGQQYFVQTDGSLGTSADSPSVIAGTAIGTSELIVKG